MVELDRLGRLVVSLILDGLESRHAAESADISKGTLTGVVRTLESRGWMTRRARTMDRRLVHLDLTPDGVDLMEKTTSSSSTRSRPR